MKLFKKKKQNTAKMMEINKKCLERAIVNLMHSFNFNKTPEGVKYWDEVLTRLIRIQKMSCDQKLLKVKNNRFVG